jgi:hypothetical protein
LVWSADFLADDWRHISLQEVVQRRLAIHGQRMARLAAAPPDTAARHRRPSRGDCAEPARHTWPRDRKPLWTQARGWGATDRSAGHGWAIGCSKRHPAHRRIEMIDYFGFVLPKFAKQYNHKFISLNCIQPGSAGAPHRRPGSQNLRRDGARRSYRSTARNCFAARDRIVASFCGPFRRRGHKIHQGFNRHVRGVRSQQPVQDSHFLRHVCSGVIVRIAQCMGQDLMARVTHAAEIDLRFGDPACEFSYFPVGVGPGNFTRHRFQLFR